MLRRLGIRGKILAVLAVPLLVLFTAAGILSAQAWDQSRRAAAVQTLLTALGDSRELVGALQVERDTSAVSVDPYPSHSVVNVADTSKSKRDAVLAARSVTDLSLSRFQRDVTGVDYALLDPSVPLAVTDAQAGLKGLAATRHSVDTTSALSSVVNGDYTTMISANIQLLQRAASLLTNRDVALSLASLAAVDNVVEYMEIDKVVGLQMLRYGVATGEPLDSEQRQLVTRTFAVSDNIHEFAATQLAQLGDDALVLPDLGASNTGFLDYASSRQRIGAGASADLKAIREIDLRRQVAAEVAALKDLRGALSSRATSDASSAAGSALRNMLGTIAATIGVLGASMLIALTTARVITRPLRRLTAATAKVEEDLPRLVEQVPGQGPDLDLVKIPVESNDEVGRLAAAFNGVNETTVRIAQEQAALRGSIAEMFVNVARRDQVLLNRQLGFLDQLERSEEDPDILGNLFKLDHLATRMRRNAESLLVLAGIDSGRRIRGQMALSNVIRTASSEIEHYERVQLALPIDPSMRGHNALASAHLLAELLENATVFSEPGTPVEVETAMDEFTVTVTIVDHGLGMSGDELVAANVKIASVSATDVLGTQRLGLYVVGRIAQRLGATVELSKTTLRSGTLAAVVFPRSLFVAEERREIRVPGAFAPASFPIAALALREEYAPEFQHGEPLEAFGRGTATGLGARDRWPADLPAPDTAAAEPAEPAEPVEPMAPLVKPVNLAELTDGRTDLGLPRRRTRPDGAADDGSARISEADLAAGRHVLPELPTLAGWSPDGLVDSAGPSPGAASRVGIFSGFRSRRAAARAGAESVEDAPFQPVMIPSTPLVPRAEEPSEPDLPVPTIFVTEVIEADAEPGSTTALTSIGHHVADDTFDGAPTGATAEPGLGFEAASDDVAAPEEYEFQGVGFGEQEPPQFVVPTLEPDDDYDVTPFEAEFGASPAVDAAEDGEVAALDADVATPYAAEEYPTGVHGSIALEPDHGALPQFDGSSFAEADHGALPQFDGSSFAEAAYGVGSGQEVPVRYEAYPTAEAASYPSPNAYTEYPYESPEVSSEVSLAFDGSVAAAMPPVDPGFSQILAGAAAAPKGLFRRLFGRQKHVPAVAPDAPAPDILSGIIQPGPLGTAPGVPTSQPDVPVSSTPTSAPGTAATPYQAPDAYPAEPSFPTAETYPAEPSFPTAETYPAEPSYPEQPAPWTQHAYEAPPVFEPEPAPVPEPEPEPEPAPVPEPESAPAPVPERSPYAPTFGAEEHAYQPYQPVESPKSGPEFTPAPDGGGATAYQSHLGDGSTAHSYTPMFVPNDAPMGSMASEAARMLAERSDIAQQALSEFSQLSSYRPSTVDGGKTTLTRRVPAAVPETPLIVTRPAATAAGGAVSTASEPREARDAEQVRSLLASFQSGSSRGRRATHVVLDMPRAGREPHLGDEASGDPSVGLDASDSTS